MKSPRLYRKLAAAHKVGFSTGGWISLHAAADHLLLRTSSGFLETYRRFYFADIEAITVRRTARGVYWNMALTIGLAVSLVLMWGSPVPHPVSGALAGVFAFLLILNVSLGATCATQLQTRVQRRALPLRRVRKALRVVDRLFAEIEAAQAQIAVATPVENPVQPLAPVMATPRSSGPPPLPGEKPATRGNWLRATVFAVLLLSGAVAIVAGLQHTSSLAYAACAALLANFPIGIVALVKQHRHRWPSTPGVIVWISVATNSIVLPTAYFTFSIIHSLDMSKRSAPAPLPMQSLGALGDMPGFDIALWIYGLFCTVLALTGFFTMLVTQGRTEARG